MTLPEWRAHPLRQALALLAVALGVALAFSVHLINQSALAEFSAAVRAANGEPDASLACAQRDGCDDALFDALATRSPRSRWPARWSRSTATPSAVTASASR